MDSDCQTLEEVMGSNLRAHRERNRWSRTDVASMMSAEGIAWTPQVVGAVERGERPMSVAEMFAARHALGIEPRALFAGEGCVTLSDELAVRDVGELRKPFSVRPSQVDDAKYLTSSEIGEMVHRMNDGLKQTNDLVRRWWPDRGSMLDVVKAERTASGEAEVKAARKLGVSPFVVSLLAHRLWGQSFTDHRDKVVNDRAEPSTDRRSIQARRGHVTRQLLSDLAEIIEKEG